jgi:cell wall-associated NlpC family hydrolase
VQRLGEKELVDSVVILPEKRLEPRIYGIVDVSVTSLYDARRYEAELVDQVLLGHTVKVLKESHGWYFVKVVPEPPLNKGYLGWVDTEGIIRVDSAAYAAYAAASKLIVTSTFAILRSSPNGGTMVSDIVMRDFLKPISQVGSNFKVQLPDGRIAYISSSDAENYSQYFLTHKPTPEGIESLARKFLGFPYLWGGTSTKGLDCSGFVNTVFAMNGINLPRDANEQAEVGENVDPGKDFVNLRKGDLLFFGEKADPARAERISHVGIYLGGGYFIHSPGGPIRISGLLKSDSTFDPPELNRFVRAKRVLGTMNSDSRERDLRQLSVISR